jgi:hypothetical protein
MTSSYIYSTASLQQAEYTLLPFVTQATHHQVSRTKSYTRLYAVAAMDQNAVNSLMSTVGLISTNLDTRPDSWREQLQAIRSTTRSLEILDGSPEEAQKRWQLPLISVFQRVAFADADNGPVQDVADWCLRQALTLLHLYPQDVEILACMCTLPTHVYND